MREKVAWSEPSRKQGQWASNLVRRQDTHVMESSTRNIEAETGKKGSDDSQTTIALPTYILLDPQAIEVRQISTPDHIELPVEPKIGPLVGDVPHDEHRGQAWPEKKGVEREDGAGVEKAAAQPYYRRQEADKGSKREDCRGK